MSGLGADDFDRYLLNHEFVSFEIEWTKSLGHEINEILQTYTRTFSQKGALNEMMPSCGVCLVAMDQINCVSHQCTLLQQRVTNPSVGEQCQQPQTGVWIVADTIRPTKPFYVSSRK